MLGTATAALLGLSVMGCSDSKMTTDEISPELNPRNEGGCREWEWDDDTGTYVCDDDSSSYRGYFFYGGQLYRSSSLLKSDSAYKKYASTYKSGSSSVPPRITKSSDSTKSNATTNKSSSGFGKGFFGGTGG